ncbi:major facilitator superfamily domain-containing protein [Talaromyces proteolyticus]|uniref:Citrate exporter 1 n=1 Tax=Talaromyces proteolyticus TaxID=1131652 RepID=A0AAD4PZ21_9EURO|nr:major facilitator superfamily domain-containing protein [Talaromyces proteolyticus]KAH8695219.1 major facilitator superfamily domain-containing protein [Talaromyces proteolyticus]
MFLVIMVSASSFFSPLSANIYYPIFDVLARYYNVSNTLTNLTVTTYMILQGIAPTLIAGVSDGAGRRPAFIICFIIYLGANLGLALQTNYAAILVLRMVQSAGSSSTIALASAVVADIATSSERGYFTGWASSGQFIGPGIGPIIGGLLNHYLGWRSVFWFLLISSGVIFLIMLLFYPETCRKIVGDGTIPPPKWNMSVLTHYHLKKHHAADKDRPKANKITILNPLETLAVIFEMEVGLTLFAVAVSFASYYAVISSIPSQFTLVYHYNDIQIALCFLPIGLGAMLAVLGGGRAVDLNYRRYAKNLGFPLVKTKQTDLRHFPIEKARLEIALPVFTIQALSTIGYGWCIHYGTNLAGPLIFLFILTTSAALCFTIMSILLVDLNPAGAGKVAAANNLVRCGLGAAATVAIIPMINAMGSGWASTFFGFLCMAFSPILLVIMKWGPEWRERRRLKEEENEEKAAAKKEREAAK